MQKGRIHVVDPQMVGTNSFFLLLLLLRLATKNLKILEECKLKIILIKWCKMEASFEDLSKERKFRNQSLNFDLGEDWLIWDLQSSK